MNVPSKPPIPGLAHPMSRRQLFRSAGLVGAGLALSGPLLSSCANGAGGGGGGTTLRIGFVSPRTGRAAAFGEPDGYALDLAREALRSGLTIGGTDYDVEIVDKDSQSDPQRASQVANDLITSDEVDLVLTTSTPETVNPVSDACEAAGVPCISTVVPWQAWYLGRGADPTDAKAFRYTYHFCFGVEQFAAAYPSLWSQVDTNRKVGVMWPNDSDGNAIRAALGPQLTDSGFTLVDPGAYTNGSSDYSAQIAQFKAEDAQIMSTFPIPSDFATFWQQAAQQGWRPLIAQTAKTGLFPSQVEALGDIGIGLASAAYWTPTFPYSSSLTGTSSADLATGYTEATGSQWNQQLGATMALFDVGAAALQAVDDPKDREAVAEGIGSLSVETTVGTVTWGDGPNGNVVTTPVIGGQWVRATSGDFPLDFVLCENANDPNVPIAATLQPYGSL